MARAAPACRRGPCVSRHSSTNACAKVSRPAGSIGTYIHAVDSGKATASMSELRGSGARCTRRSRAPSRRGRAWIEISVPATTAAAACPGTTRMRMCALWRVASIQPRQASQTIRKPLASSVQLTGGSGARDTTPATTVPSSTTTSAPAAIAAGGRSQDHPSVATRDEARLQRPAGTRRCPLPHFSANCAGTLASTGLRQSAEVGLDHRHARGLEGADQRGLLAEQFLVLPRRAVGQAACSTSRSAGRRPFQKASFTITMRGVMMCSVSTRNFCTSKNLPLWIVGSGFSWPSTAPWLSAR